MFRLFLSLVLALTLVAGAAKAQAPRIVTGNDVLRGLEVWDKPAPTSAEFDEGWYVDGYITGISDALVRSGGIFIPSGATNRQTTDIVKKYLSDNPAIRNLSASLGNTKVVYLLPGGATRRIYHRWLHPHSRDSSSEYRRSRFKKASVPPSKILQTCCRMPLPSPATFSNDPDS
jgi:hypothetical protein